MNDGGGWLRTKLRRLFVTWDRNYLAVDLHRAFLGREPDSVGLAFSAALIEAAGSIAPLVDHLLNSSEFRQKSVGAAAPEVVEAIYKWILARQPDPDGLASSAASLQTDGSVASLVDRLLNSSEFRRRSIAAAAPELVAAAYVGLLGRSPDAPGLKMHVERLVRDHDAAALLRNMTGSREFLQKMEAKLAATPAVSPVRAAISRGAIKGRLIVVSSNCQTAGVAAALQWCLPSDTVVPSTLPEGRGAQAEKEFLADLAEADVWVAAWDVGWAQKRGFEGKPGFQAIKIPVVAFPAFHPDLCYAVKTADGKLTQPNYNSGIGVWAYVNGLETKDAVKLFNRGTYAGLGYFDQWNPSVAALRSSFEACNFDFPRFMLAIKRSGLFMHSINHPKINVLVELAKQVSLKIGASASVVEKQIDVADALAVKNWPLYPEIAEELSLPHGSYDWKVVNRPLLGVEAYLDDAFHWYERQKIPRTGLKMRNRDQSLYDRVLGPLAGVPV